MEAVRPTWGAGVGRIYCVLSCGLGVRGDRDVGEAH